MNPGNAAEIPDENERKFSILFDKIGIPVALSRLPDGTLVDVNKAWVSTFGFSREEAIGKTTLELNINMNTENRSQTLSQLKETGSVHDIELLLRTKSGECRNFLVNIDIVEIGGQKYLLNTAQDITERKQIGQQLEQNNKKLNQILDSIQDDFYVIDRDWKFVYASRLFTSKVGKEPEDFIGRDIWELFPKHLGTIFEENLRAAMEKREVRRFEIPGKYTKAWYRMRVFPSEEGITLLGTDITERKRAEEQLQYQATLLAHVNDAVVASDANYCITVWNTGAEILYGWKAEEVIGRKGLEFVRTEWPEKNGDEMRRAIAEVGQWRGEAIQSRKDGSHFPVEISTIVLYDENHQITSYVSINRDITERTRAEAALRENEKQLQSINETLEHKVHEKTAEVRQLASNLIRAEQRERHRISHILHDDLQQRIYVAQMQLTFLRDDIAPLNERLSKQVANIEKQVEDILKITRHLSIDLSPPILRDEGLSHAIDWLAAQMSKRYGIKIDLQAEGSFIIPDEELHVLLFNCVRELLFNIVKHAEASQATVALQWVDDKLHIEVGDNGKGFPVNKIGQLEHEAEFEEDGMPTSYGLPTIRYQLSLFSGRMEIQSESGKGTHIVLIVPIPESV